MSDAPATAEPDPPSGSAAPPAEAPLPHPRGAESSSPRPHSAETSRPRPHGAESSRPRPQYGEYATPEEQRARIQAPAPWQQELATPIMTEEAPAAGIPSPSQPAEPAPRRPRPVDRIVTFALLAYGLVNVVSAVPAFLDYGAYAETMLTMLGVDVQVSDPADGRAWGIAAVLVLTIGWCATVAVSFWSVRRGRLTWWIPLVAGILFTFAAGALMAAPLLSDPAVWQALIDSAGG
jgi:hypothetical protein